MTKLLIPEKDESAALVASLVGRTIVDAAWFDAQGGWGPHEFAVLLLDDGRLIEFHAWGHDAWGVTIGESTADAKYQYKAVTKRFTQ